MSQTSAEFSALLIAASSLRRLAGLRLIASAQYAVPAGLMVSSHSEPVSKWLSRSLEPFKWATCLALVPGFADPPKVIKLG